MSRDLGGWEAPAETKAAAETMTVASEKDGADPSPTLHEFRVLEELDRQRAQREARRLLDAEERGPVVLPEFVTLRELLARPLPPLRMRIGEWMPEGARVVLSAQYKAGKTTTRDNLIRSLVDGDPWLGRYHVRPVEGPLVIFDTEMSERQMRSWLADQHITRDDRVVPVSLRGRAAQLDLCDSEVRAEWATWLRERRVSVAVLDCLRPVLDALGLDEQNEAGKFLTAFDALLSEAGITEAFVIHHMGHNNERSRGDSRIRDWPDVEWRIVRQDEQPGSDRYISAYGRDVDIPESKLSYDAATRRLIVAGGSRRDAKLDAALDVIVPLLEKDEPLSGRAIKGRLADSEIGRDTIDAALSYGVRTDVLSQEQGPRNARLYRRVSERPAVSDQCPADGPSECPATYRKPDTRTLVDEAVSVRARTVDGTTAQGGAP